MIMIMMKIIPNQQQGTHINECFLGVRLYKAKHFITHKTAWISHKNPRKQ